MPLAYDVGSIVRPGNTCTVEDEVFTLVLIEEAVADILRECGNRGLEHLLNDMMMRKCKEDGVDPYLYLTAIDRGNQWQREHDKENHQVIYSLKVDD